MPKPKPKPGGKKKKPKVKEIDGVLWLLDNNGNPVKKVKKKAKPGENNEGAGGGGGHHSPSGGSGGDSNSNINNNDRRKKQRPNIKEIDGILYQLDEQGNPVKKLRRKGDKTDDNRRRAMSQGPIAGMRRPRERIDTGDQRLRSRSVGKDQQKAGEYTDAKGRKVVVDEDGNKTVFDKNGRRLRPKKKPNSSENDPVNNNRRSSTTTTTNNNNNKNNHKPALDNRHALMESSIHTTGIFDDIWGDKQTKNDQIPQSPSHRMNTHGSSLQSSSDCLSLSHTELMALTSPTKNKINGSNGSSNNNSNNARSNYNNNEDNNNNNNNAQIAELGKKVSEYGEENRDLKTQLMTVEDKVRTLTQQNQKEKSKNVKATTNMLQLKADFQQSSDEKRNLDLQIKNLEARLRAKEKELEKIESTPANRRISTAGSGSDHLVTQITDLMAENDALLDKLELAKASSGHDVKKKEEQILFLNEELKKLRQENDELFRGEAEKDPLMGKLFKKKKEIEEKMKHEKEKATIRTDSMQETIDGLEKSNAVLKKELEKATLEINDDDDDDVRHAKEMAQAVAKHGTGGTALQVKRTTSMTSGKNNREGPPRRHSGFGWGFSTANTS